MGFVVYTEEGMYQTLSGCYADATVQAQQIMPQA